MDDDLKQSDLSAALRSLLVSGEPITDRIRQGIEHALMLSVKLDDQRQEAPKGLCR